ncbi:cobalamin B12-binding domain-containing protein [Streptomyces sp. HB2AG]|uniref:cobalamin B12-binding domain-containing protein n=1 Tax=Streptomyces sp. HB2AG TaxID=2983400 RepID=UPI0022AA26E6|nr:cobalamin-dependent protein [Streptomyces sp. HB2AG]MCZ2523669.1 cobalamin-dependent protein [Streptomyces sp. HB2AG]
MKTDPVVPDAGPLLPEAGPGVPDAGPLVPDAGSAAARTGPADPEPGRARRVLLSSVSSDAHTWNLVFLQLLLEEAGCEVVNLGACVPDELLIGECAALRPDLLVISTVNGHGRADGERLIGRLRARPELRGVPAVIGGKLGVRGGDEEAGRALVAAGFDAVFQDDAAPELFVEFVRALEPAPAGRVGTP